MASRSDSAGAALLADETGTIRTDGIVRVRVALVYPNTYAMGMSNLGFQTVYRLLNALPGVACERAFAPAPALAPSSASAPASDAPARKRAKKKGRKRSDGQQIAMLESGLPVGIADIIAFSISFENDYPNLLAVLRKAGLPLLAGDRDETHPLVMAGGVACMLNPEPIAPFVDLFFLGEAEAGLAPLFEGILAAADRPDGKIDIWPVDKWPVGKSDDQATTDRDALLLHLARSVSGVYVPRFYRAEYGADGTLADFSPTAAVPRRIRRPRVLSPEDLDARTAVLTPHTHFDNAFLLEVGRGCPHGCRFCGAGFIYRPQRYMPWDRAAQWLDKAAEKTDRVGLVSAAVSDFPGIESLCHRAAEKGVRLSFSSLRADGLSPELVTALREGGVKTATIAPDAGSERMRRVINKGLGEPEILGAVERLVAGGIFNLKLYFMIGLPTETDADAAAIVDLCGAIKQRFLEASRPTGRIGSITVSLNAFAPKPFTPFQWAAMADRKTLGRRAGIVRSGLAPMANVRLNADSHRQAHIQAVLARGDRRVAGALISYHENGGDWGAALRESGVSIEFYALRERDADERFPWDFIDHGVARSYLAREYRRALAAKPTPPCPMEGCAACGVCENI